MSIESPPFHGRLGHRVWKTPVWKTPVWKTPVRKTPVRRTPVRPALLAILLAFVALPLRADVIVTELHYHPPAGSLEFVELCNVGTSAVDLSGWELTRGVLYEFADGTSLAPGAYLVVGEDRTALIAAGLDPDSVHGNWLGSLSNGGERLDLRNRSGALVDSVSYSDAPPFPSSADGGGRSLERLCLTQSASIPSNWRASLTVGGTPLAENSQAACPPPPAAADSPVVFNEIQYHPSDDPNTEFIEFHNRTDDAIDLHDWRLQGGVDFTFNRVTGPTVIFARDYLLVAKDVNALAAATGLATDSIAGPYTGVLSNFSDTLELALPDGFVIERVSYSQDGLWPARADGLGSSLQLIQPEISSALPQNWTVAGDSQCLPTSTCVLVRNGSSVRWFENIDGSDPGFSGGLPWYDPEFDDEANGWDDGQLAVGYDTRVPNGQPWVLTPSTATDGLHSILLRVEFDYDPAADCVDTLSLGVDQDDGFVAWLNGVEIARGGMTDPAGTVPPFDGSYRSDIVTAGGFRAEAPVYTNVWTGDRTDLQVGRNVLAIGNYNSRSTSSDLYLSARLSLGGGGAGVGDATPASPNSVGAATAPPLIATVEHLPSEPTSSNSVRVEAAVHGPAASVTLYYDAGSGEQPLDMRDDGAAADRRATDGVWTASIPAQPDDTLVKYRLEALAPGGSCPASFPRAGNPSPHTGYYVQNDRPEVSVDERLFYIFTPGALTDLSCTSGARREGTFVDFRGRAYFNIGVKFRGETACSYPKKPLRVEFNKGDTFDGQRDVNFSAGWNDKALLRERLGFNFFRDASVAYSETHFARVHTNGGAFHGAYFTIEDPSSEYLRRNDWARASLYKCRSAMLNGSTGGYEPRTDDAEASLTDVGAFATAMNSRSGEALKDLLLEDLNVESVIDYQAVQVIIIDGDSVVKNWLLYLGPHGTAKEPPDKFAMFAWDIDLSHGQMYLTQDVRHHDIHPLFQTQTYPFVGQGHHGIINALLQRSPDDYFVKAYYGRMWNLLEEKFNPAVSIPKINAYDANTIGTAEDDLRRWRRTWGARGDDPSFWRQDLKNWLVRRYNFLRNYLLANNPTTGGRSFRYTPAPKLKFSEIHYNPEGNIESLEFLELRNLESSSVDVSGWTIPAIGYEFPAGSEIDGESYCIVAKNPTVLAATHDLPANVDVFGPYAGNLRNGGEEVRLRDNGQYNGKTYFPETIDIVVYDDKTPWATAADGDGPSLELVSLETDNDFAHNWRASNTFGGTPGTGFGSNAPPTIQVTVTPESGPTPLRVEFDASGSFDPEGDAFTFAWEFSDGVIGAGPEVTRTFFTAGTYQATVTLEAAVGPSATETFEVTAFDAPTPQRFVRGDVNADTAFDISDAFTVFLAVVGERTIDCDQSGDIDDNGSLQITDALLLLNFLFELGPPPDAPFPNCGTDATAGGLDCGEYSRCP